MKSRIAGVAIVSALVGIILSSGASGTALPPEVMESLKEVRMLEVTKDNVDVIWNLRANQDPDMADIVDLRLNYRDISTELSMVLQEWVGGGKGVVLYQSNVHRFFPEIGISDGSRERSPILKAVKDSHPVVIGVQEVVFRTRSFYSITGELQSPHIPILETEEGEVVAIASCCGRGGVVVFLNSDNWKGAPWGKEGYDNERFTINIQQWLAGACVPGLSGRKVAGGPCYRLENYLTPEMVERIELLAVRKKIDICQLIGEVFAEYLSK